MNFFGLDKNYIRKNSKKTCNGFYELVLGSPIEVTTTLASNSNNLIANNLSCDVKSDKLMMRYNPINTIYFSEALIDLSDGNHVSCHIDNTMQKVYIGTPNEFEMTTGVLMFSGELSVNNLVEKDKVILGNSRVVETIKKRVRILSVGLKGDNLFALYYLPSARGMAVSINDTNTMGVSTITMKEKDCSGYSSFTIKDWFSSAMIKER